MVSPADGSVPIVARPRSVNLGHVRAAAWQAVSTCVTHRPMSLSPLDQAFDRAERALLRIERSVERGAMHRGRDDALRGKVATVVAELDELIRTAGVRG